MEVRNVHLLELLDAGTATTRIERERGDRDTNHDRRNRPKIIDAHQERNEKKNDLENHDEHGTIRAQTGSNN